MALSGIANIGDVQLMSIAALRRRLQAGGNLRMYSMNMNEFKGNRGRRQIVRVPRARIQAKRALANPDLGVLKYPSSITHVDMDWIDGPNAGETSYPLTWSYDRWEMVRNGIAPEVINVHAANQAMGYEQFWDAECIKHLKTADAWGFAVNTREITMTAGDDPSDAIVESWVNAALETPYLYWDRGMQIPASDADGSANRRIVSLWNRTAVVALLRRFYDDRAIGSDALDSQPFLQAYLGPILGGMTIVISREFDKGFTAAGDEFIFGTWLVGSIADLYDDSPPINDTGYTATGDPTLEMRVGHWRDTAIQHLDPLECMAVKSKIA